MIEISSKEELILALQDSSRRAEAWFQAIPSNDFFVRQENVWSPSDNLDHLIRAITPIIKGLKLPKITLQAMFGKAEKSSVSYGELCSLYRDAIARGAQASGRYLPNQQSPGEAAEKQKNSLLERWIKASDALAYTAESWAENDLDLYQLPHPLIGKLTVREMLFFVIYHNLRHASLEGD